MIGFIYAVACLIVAAALIGRVVAGILQHLLSLPKVLPMMPLAGGSRTTQLVRRKVRARLIPLLALLAIMVSSAVAGIVITCSVVTNMLAN